MDAWQSLRKGLRGGLNSIESNIQLVYESLPQVSLAGFVPVESIDDVCLGTRADMEAGGHPSRILALTSSQGEAALGFLRDSSNLRSSSCLVSSVISICSGHSAMLSQISVTSWIRSGTESFKASAAVIFMSKR